MRELGVKVDVRNCLAEKEPAKALDVHGKDSH